MSLVYVIRTLPPYVAGACTCVNAIIAALASVVWLGEWLTPRITLSAVLVLGGVRQMQGTQQ
jgi:drug/metabolite transporter (DMT)-like permease